MNIFLLFKKRSKEDQAFFRSLKKLLGQTPKKLSLYKQAFTHKSIEDDKHNERLEYLGDSILNTIVSEYLFNTFQHKDEGSLTRYRSKIVSREQLNSIGEKLNLKQFLVYRMNVKVENSSILGNALEALIGAIYLDLGYKRTVRFVEQNLLSPFIDLAKIEHSQENYKSVLLEWTQKERKELRYEIEDVSNDSSQPKYEAQVFVDNALCGKGTGRSKKKAEQKAALQACKHSLNLI